MIEFPNLDFFDRKLRLLSLPDYDSLLADLKLSSPHFACFLACDARETAVDTVGRFAESLVKQGLALICVWGSGCRRVEDIFDEIDVERMIYEKRDRPVIMSTSHADDALDDALWYFLYVADPVPEYQPTCTVGLIIVVGNHEWASDIQRQLSGEGKKNDG